MTVRDGACGPCRRRVWLLEALAGPLDIVRARLDELLALGDHDLIEAVGGDLRPQLHEAWRRFDPDAHHARCRQAGLATTCRCDPGYPAGLGDLTAPPAVLHVAGDPALLAPGPVRDAVAIVGARRASTYGTEVARSLAAGVGTAGLTVVSGMALGVDAAAHRGALHARAGTIAVLAGGADRPYPASHRALYQRIRAAGAIVSELGPGIAPRRWMFPARNRIIAALAAMTVVVQARERSGALVTARWAGALGRELGAVPGSVTTSLSAGPHGLIAAGARLVSGPQDVLDGLFGAGAVPAAQRRRDRLDPHLSALLDALSDGETGEGAFTRAGLDTDGGLAALASLELAGIVRRGAGGRYSVL